MRFEVGDDGGRARVWSSGRMERSEQLARCCRVRFGFDDDDGVDVGIGQQSDEEGGLERCGCGTP